VIGVHLELHFAVSMDFRLFLRYSITLLSRISSSSILRRLVHEAVPVSDINTSRIALGLSAIAHRAG
jgi:hypothetical protein